MQHYTNINDLDSLQKTVKEAIQLKNNPYQFENLGFKDRFSGTRQVVNGNLNLKKWNIQNKGSFLKSDSDYSSSVFIRNQTQVKYHFKKNCELYKLT